MGYKGDKRRPGREGWKNEKKPRCVVVTYGEHWVSIDTRTGDFEFSVDADELETWERDEITGAVLAVLVKYGKGPHCPLDVRDALFG